MRSLEEYLNEPIRRRLALCPPKRDPDRWIADRMRHIESSGIRKVFELARSLKDPVNLSIGQPDFDVPEPIKAAAHAAIDRGANAYTVTQGIPELRARSTPTCASAIPTTTAKSSSPAAPAAASSSPFAAPSTPATRWSSSIPISSCIRTSSRWPAARRFTSIPTRISASTWTACAPP